MIRWFSSVSGALVVFAALAGSAQAEGRREVVITPKEAFTPRAPDAAVSPYIYLNRCVGNCTIHSGNSNDARTNTSSIPSGCAGGNCTVTEFSNAFGQISTSSPPGTCTGDGTTKCTTDTNCATPGGFCDTAAVEWGLVMQCLKEVYSPYAVTLQETIPSGGVSYTMAVIAGHSTEIGQTNQVLGIAPLTCSAQDNVISFSFANDHVAQTVQDRVWNICWTAAQETAHAFGLDHEYSFLDGSSACNDPMTYRNDCGGEKFFRNKTANVGTYGATAQYQVCRALQNSHQEMLSVFGPGMSLIPAPTVSIISPANNTAVAANFPVFASAGSKRGVAKVELWINGYNWTSVGGAMFQAEGQPNPSEYTLVAPNGVPDGAMAIVVKAYDDLDIETDSAPLMLQKGSSCTADTNCATGQHCNTGAAMTSPPVPTGGCYWDPPAGMLGQKCSYPEFCTSGLCEGTSATDQICTQDCVVGATDACPAHYDCTPAGNTGYCFPAAKGGGCCDTSGAGTGWVYGALAALVLGVVSRRRRAR